MFMQNQFFTILQVLSAILKHPLSSCLDTINISFFTSKDNIFPEYTPVIKMVRFIIT